MSNHPEDDSTELKPGDVIYINEPKPTEPAKDLASVEPPPEPKPEPKPRPPTFDIPLAEEKNPIPDTKPPVSDTLTDDDKKMPPAELEEEEVAEEEDLEEPEPLPAKDDSRPSEAKADETDEPQAPAGQAPPPRPKLQPLGDTLPEETTPTPSVSQGRLSPLNAVPPQPALTPPPQLQAPPMPSNTLPPASLPPQPAVSNPPPEPFFQPPAPAVLPAVQPPSQPSVQPGRFQPGQDFSFISPQAAVGAPLPAQLGQEALTMPALPAEAPRPPAWPPTPTTDLQGNLAAAVPAQSPPVALPIPAVEEDKPVADVVPAGEKSNRGLKVFGVITLLIIAATIVLGAIFLGPMLRRALESNQLNEVREFEHVLVNLLQVKNQEIEIKLTDSQLDNIVPNLANQDAVSDGRISISGTLKVDYSTETATPAVSSAYEFDLSLQTANRRDNLILDIAVVFTDKGEAYFKLDDLKINDRAVNLEETDFAGRWSDLEALLQVRAGGETAVLEGNESVFLNYIANLLDLYSYPHYVPLLPAFNISKSQDYNQARDILLQSGAYDLDSGSCRSANDTELTCQLAIDYDKLYTAYEDIYGVLGQSMPAHYGILQVADNPSHNLPKVVDITFDKDRDEPVSISVRQSASEEISASSLLINYKSFDEAAFELRSTDDPLSLVEYHEQILNYEQEIDFR